MFNLTVDKIVEKLASLVEQLDSHAKAKAEQHFKLEQESQAALTEHQRALRIKTKLQELIN